MSRLPRPPGRPSRPSWKARIAASRQPDPDTSYSLQCANVPATSARTTSGSTFRHGPQARYKQGHRVSPWTSCSKQGSWGKSAMRRAMRGVTSKCTIVPTRTYYLWEVRPDHRVRRHVTSRPASKKFADQRLQQARYWLVIFGTCDQCG